VQQRIIRNSLSLLGKEETIKWLATYAALSSMMEQQHGFRDKDAFMRALMVRQGIEQFFIDEGIPPGQIEIEL